MDNEEFERHFGFNPAGVNGVIENGFFGKTVYRNISSYLMSIVPKVIIGGLVGLLGAEAVSSYQNLKEFDNT